MDKLQQIHLDAMSYETTLQSASKSAEITKDVAIKFAEWLRFNCNETRIGWQITGKQYTDSEIFEEFLKQL